MSGIDANTKLMLHCDGADGGTVFTDSSGSAFTVTPAASAQIDTGQYKFGTASGQFDGDSDYLSVPDNAVWYFGTGSFTIDFWVRFAALPADQCSLWSQYTDGSNFIRFYRHNNGNWYFSNTTGGTQTLVFAAETTVNTNTWYHMALVRNGGSFAIYQDGTSVGTMAGTSEVVNIGAAVTIGYHSGGNYFGGWLDEYRVSTGTARWTSNFAVPTEAYSSAVPGHYMTTNTRFW